MNPTPTWQERFEEWYDSQYGTAGWQMKLKSFITSLLLEAEQRGRDEACDLIEAKWKNLQNGSVINMAATLESARTSKEI